MNVVKDVFLKEKSLGTSVSAFYGTPTPGCRPGSHWNSGEGQTGLQHSGLIIWEVLAARPVYLRGGFHKPTHSIPKLTSC